MCCDIFNVIFKKASKPGVIMLKFYAEKEQMHYLFIKISNFLQSLKTPKLF